jgi:hypothetical protein
MSRITTFFLALVGGLVALSPLAQADASQCISGGDGHVACGYHCMSGGNGHAACSNVPWGACMSGGDGQAVCYLASHHGHRDPAPAQCISGGDGHAACGYHCISGGDGHAACANAPYGACRSGGDGHAVCFP